MKAHALIFRRGGSLGEREFRHALSHVLSGNAVEASDLYDLAAAADTPRRQAAFAELAGTPVDGQDVGGGGGGADLGRALREGPASYIRAYARLAVNHALNQTAEDTRTDITRHGEWEGRSQRTGKYSVLHGPGTTVVFDRGTYFTDLTAPTFVFLADASGAYALAATNWNVLELWSLHGPRKVATIRGLEFTGRAVSHRDLVAWNEWAWHPVSYVNMATAQQLRRGKFTRTEADLMDNNFERPLRWVGAALAVGGVCNDEVEHRHGIQLLSHTGKTIAAVTGAPAGQDAIDNADLSFADGTVTYTNGSHTHTLAVPRQ